MKQEKKEVDWYYLLMLSFWALVIVGVTFTNEIDTQTKVILYLMAILGIQINNN